MSTNHSMIEDMTQRLLAEQLNRDGREAFDDGRFEDGWWATLEASGLADLLVPEDAGGAGGGVLEMVPVMKILGRHAAPGPMAETMLARAALAGARIGNVPGPLALSAGHAGLLPEPSGSPRDASWSLERRGGQTLLRGGADAVKGARHASRIVVVVPGSEAGSPDCVCVVEPSSLVVNPRTDIGGDAVDTLHADGVAVEAHPLLPGQSARQLFMLAALSRAALMAGAMEACLDLSVGYVKDRVVFGRPLSKLQAVQQQLADMAGDVAAAVTVTHAAAQALHADHSELMLAAARARVADAADKSAAVSHQVHGAMGFAREYELHWRTRRLWAWRDEFGTAFQWRARLGQAFAGAGADALWPALATA